MLTIAVTPASFAACAKYAAALMIPNTIVLAYGKQIGEFSAKNRIPLIYDTREFIEDSGLMSYGPSVLDTRRRAATYVDKILKGAKPADLPVEQPTKFELIINLKAAKALGMTMPPSLLLLADEVIQ